MDLTTNYLGLSLRSPLVPSASPLSEKIDNVRQMEQAGAAAVVLYSLFEEEIDAVAPECRVGPSAGASAALALPWTVRQAFAAPSARSLLTKYIQLLPFPGAGIVVATPSGLNQYAFTQREIARQLHPDLRPTPFWAYDDGSGLGGQAGSFGMALVAENGTALDVSFTNDINPSPDRDGRISAEQRRGLSSLAGLVHLPT